MTRLHLLAIAIAGVCALLQANPASADGGKWTLAPARADSVGAFSDAVVANAESVFRSCPDAEPREQTFFAVTIDDSGRVVSVSPAALPTQHIDGVHLRGFTSAEQRGLRVLQRCFARLLRRVRFRSTGRQTIDVTVFWESHEPQVMGRLQS